MCQSFIPPLQSTRRSPASGNCMIDIGNESTKHLAQHLVLLLDVIHSRRWSAFENIALSNPEVFRMICASIPRTGAFKGGTTLLHECLQCDVPLETVVKMFKMLPDRTDALRARDSLGRTPLHIAVASAADPLVVKLIGSANPEACTILDEDGRTPLHLACDSTNTIQVENFKCQQHMPQQNEARSYNTVRALLSESPEASLVEDEDGMSALEYAIMSDASIELVTLLQIASMESLRGGWQHHSTKKRRLPYDVSHTTSLLR
mmetsp:Transcript_25402/g.43369  ORF Transcript_25402/g.43369 Transcript_25402/m.43369 type:complete len:262 (+) Transcript_25402:204-989(+)